MIAFDANALVALVQVLAIDLVLAGDNAVAVGLAAAGLPPAQRRRAVLIGLGVAVATRIAFALIAVQLLQVTGLLLIGGLLLAWVCWTMWQDLRGSAENALADTGATGSIKTLGAAVSQIVIADVSMSLDNVLAVAGAARDHPNLLIVGLLLSIALMGVAASAIAKLFERYRWVGYVGLAIVAVVSVRMIAEGVTQVIRALA